MYIESFINDYYERNDFDVSSFQFLVSMSEDYRNKELMEEINEELNKDSDIQLDEANDLPF